MDSYICKFALNSQNKFEENNEQLSTALLTIIRINFS